MEQIADFRIQIVKDATKYTLTLSSAGDDFVVELEDPKDLLDEVEELVQDQLGKYGIEVFSG